MKQPTDGVAGKLWRTATTPQRVAAPVTSIGKRVLKAEFWSETRYERPGSGPTLDMVDHPHIKRPEQGTGPLIHRRYRVHILDAVLKPAELIELFRRDPNDFSPTSFATFEPTPGPNGLQVGDELKVRLPGPLDGPVVVTTSDPSSVAYETLQGHIEAGRISFTCFTVGDETVFEVESIARSGNSGIYLMYFPGKVAELIQTEMWIRVLESAVEWSGGELNGRPTVHTIIYKDTDG